MTQITIASRFNGPVASGNGGYSAGLAAAILGADAAEATLRAPIPLDRPLFVRMTDAGLDILDPAYGDLLVMSLRATTLETPDVVSPGLESAHVASATFRGAEDHVLPTCFVCGPARVEGDGLRIFPDWTQDPAGVDNPNMFPIVAAPWTPHAALADASGRVAPEFLWAALDCPGAFAVDREPILLGRMAARIVDRPPPGAPLVAVAWRKGQERRKHFAGTALFSEAGDLLAFSEQTWIQIDQHAHEKTG